MRGDECGDGGQREYGDGGRDEGVIVAHARPASKRPGANPVLAPPARHGVDIAHALSGGAHQLTYT